MNIPTAAVPEANAGSHCSAGQSHAHSAGGLARTMPTHAGKRRFIAVVGDANDPATWSGIPYHLLHAGKTAGLFDEGLPLAAKGWVWRIRRAFWNGARVLAGDRHGGYQYSTRFLEWLWAPQRARVRHAVIINCFQLYPPSIVADTTIEKWYFIDQTLLQLFDHYGQRAHVGSAIADRAVQRERQGYLAAAGVIVHSHWAATSVIEDYGIARERVHVVVPGANLDPITYARWQQMRTDIMALEPKTQSAQSPIRLVFVGKEWQRKGLDRLLRGLAVARSQGGAIELRVIGCRRESVPAELRDQTGVEWCGFVDKQIAGARFMELVGECDLGCLLSRAEAGGIALREFHALGLPVLVTDVGGAPEHAIGAAALVIPAHSGAQEIASALIGLLQNPKRLAALRQAAWYLRHSALWPRSINQLSALLRSQAGN